MKNKELKIEEVEASMLSKKVLNTRWSGGRLCPGRGKWTGAIVRNTEVKRSRRNTTAGVWLRKKTMDPYACVSEERGLVLS